jgi:hypothetical protein
MIGTGAERETAVIATVGTAGATTVGAAVSAGATVIPVAAVNSFTLGQTITIGSGADSETAVVATLNAGRGGPAITVTAPLARAHAAGTAIAGTGITLGGATAKPHAAGAQLVIDLPTPGQPNGYSSAN